MYESNVQWNSKQSFFFSILKQSNYYLKLSVSYQVKVFGSGIFLTSKVSLHVYNVVMFFFWYNGFDPNFTVHKHVIWWTSRNILMSVQCDLNIFYLLNYVKGIRYKFIKLMKSSQVLSMYFTCFYCRRNILIKSECKVFGKLILRRN